MRVDVFMNPFAGKTRFEQLEKGIKSSLFRCELFFHQCKNPEDFANKIIQAIDRSAEALIFCGGDGTLNLALQTLVPISLKGERIPSICVISSGTANDFATELKLSRAIDKAAHAIIEGRTTNVDVLRAESQGCFRYFLTNGGIGVPALAADMANQVKSWAKGRTGKSNAVSKVLGKSVQAIGPLLYDIMFGLKYFEWSNEDWHIEIDAAQKSMRTQSPVVLINNQTSLGSSFKTAPFTKNNDGYFNILSLEEVSRSSEIRAVLNVRMGSFPEKKSFSTFETKAVTLKARGKKKLTFFADGEVLFRNSEEIKIDCIANRISVYS